MINIIDFKSSFQYMCRVIYLCASVYKYKMKMYRPILKISAYICILMCMLMFQCIYIWMYREVEPNIVN